MTTLVLYKKKSREAAEWSVSAEVSGTDWCVYVCVCVGGEQPQLPTGRWAVRSPLAFISRSYTNIQGFL